jgi:hypothetical protein
VGDPSALQSEIRLRSELLALHDRQDTFHNVTSFLQRLPGYLNEGKHLLDCITLVRLLGIIEPFTADHIPPEDIQISGENYRESILANQCLSRHRGLLRVLESAFGSLNRLVELDIYLAEELSGFSRWLRDHVGDGRLTQSEYLEGIDRVVTGLLHQDLCALTFADQSFDLVLCNELFEHVYDLDAALSEIARVLRPGGRLVATFPMAFGQVENIVKATRNRATGEVEIRGMPDHHGDPLRPELGSLVYQIPGWQILDMAREAGFGSVAMHHITSWKTGVLGSDLPGILVFEAIR